MHWTRISEFSFCPGEGVSRSVPSPCAHDCVPDSHRGCNPWVLPRNLTLSLASRLPPALQVFDDFIFIFFAMEMVLKMVALGIFGKKCYLGDTWNRLDFFIVMAG